MSITSWLEKRNLLMNKKINTIFVLLSINIIALASVSRSGNPSQFVRDSPDCEAIAKLIAQSPGDERDTHFTVKLEMEFEKVLVNPFFSEEEQAQARCNVQCARLLRYYKWYFESNSDFRDFSQGFTPSKSKEEYLENYMHQKIQEAAGSSVEGILEVRKVIMNDLEISINNQMHSPMSSTKEAEQAKEWKAIIDSKKASTSQVDLHADRIRKQKELIEILKS